MSSPGPDPLARTLELVSLAPFYERLQARLIGLTDEEYLWEPAPGCQTVEPDELGMYVTGGPQSLGPLTTIAWRICHIGDALRSERNWRWLGRDPEHDDSDIRRPRTAAGGIAYLDESWCLWHGLMASLTAEELWAPIGPIGGPYGDAERIGFVIHIMDELIHHAAEVGVMRDLYAALSR